MTEAIPEAATPEDQGAAREKRQRAGVILLHGLARTRRSMRPLANYLRRCGYLVVNIGYPSRKYRVDDLARPAILPAISQLRRADVSTIHFVTHSMGGILLRSFLTAEVLPEPGKVVMLCPPNQGSELVDRFRSYSWFRLFFGPAGCQLGTAPTDLPSRLGICNRPLGIIIGNRPATSLLSRFFPGPNDGKVSVARAQLSGMQDFLIMPYGHSFIMNRRPVHEQVVCFLENGRFAR